MLKNIFQKYQTDKFTSHCYLEIYAEIFDPIKEQINNLLEIGVWKGGSMSLWNDYFLDANIYGIDINDLPIDFIIKPRMTFYKDNAYDINFIQQNFIDKSITFDVLIDDGPHTLSSMQFFAQHYSKLLNNNGILVIEDIPDINWIQQIIKLFSVELQDKYKVVDKRHINNRWDDILIILQK